MPRDRTPPGRLTSSSGQERLHAVAHEGQIGAEQEKAEAAFDPFVHDRRRSQIHALQEAGRATLGGFLPGFGEDVVSAGGLMIDGASDLEFYDEGDFLADGPRRLPVYSASRPLFEHVIRKRVTDISGVHLRSGCQFVEYLVDDDVATVTGVEVPRSEHRVRGVIRRSGR